MSVISLLALLAPHGASAQITQTSQNWNGEEWWREILDNYQDTVLIVFDTEQELVTVEKIATETGNQTSNSRLPPFVSSRMAIFSSLGLAPPNSAWNRLFAKKKCCFNLFKTSYDDSLTGLSEKRKRECHHSRWAIGKVCLVSSSSLNYSQRS